MSERSTVQLRGTVLGAGRPKVCVPLVAATTAELLAAASALPLDATDLVEWRVDHFTAVDDADAVRAALSDLRQELPDELPLLATFRTAAEGGARELAPDAVEALLVALATSSSIDALDVEQELGADVVERVIATAHAEGVVVVTSWHDFAGTPSRAELADRLARQEALGADVVKVAVTPRTPDDVLALLGATADHAANGMCPAVTMSMGALGAVSRVAGGAFGSALTFGTAGAASAPGQLEAHALRDALDALDAAR